FKYFITFATHNRLFFYTFISAGSHMNNLKINFIKIYLWKVLPMYNGTTGIDITGMNAKVVDPNIGNIT
ncbi:MAG: hypothetical protein ACJ71K_20400, partial [Nitrososphaeraceae archaeon]